MKKISIALIAATLLLGQFVIGVALATAVMNHQYKGKILPGTTISGVAVGGLNKNEAMNEIMLRYPQPTADSILVITDGEEGIYEITFGEIAFGYKYQEAVDKAFQLGKEISPLWQVKEFYRVVAGKVDIPLGVSFDKEAFSQVLAELNNQYSRQPQNAQIAYAEDQVVLLPETLGREIDVEATVNRLARVEPGDLKAELVFNSLIPQLTSEDLKDINSRLSIYVTSFDNTNPNRVHNLKLASDKINNTLIKPGDEMSLNKVLGPRTPETGYKKAPVIVGSKLTEAYGGGVCQVVTTLYNAVDLAGLEVLERHTHTIPVNYVPVGRDATIAGDILDFRFKNSGKKPVLISSELEDNKIVVTILGHRDDANSIEYSTETIREVIKYDTVYKVDESLKPGEIKVVKPGREGYEITTYEVTVINNVVVERKEISHHREEPEDALIYLSPQDKQIRK
ncbi:VanW family protein [Desulfofalx alkaliphila]|uniref:VanW family protein n=1 Tax=Desulfofalx alkaliphila TaxID=105483 RepID=UPI0004E186E1|nr:VanW family protein [Desulfofalx alkaliphila]